VSRNVGIREKYDSTDDEEDDWDVTLPCSVQEQQESTTRDLSEKPESARPRQLRDRATLKQSQWYEANAAEYSILNNYKNAMSCKNKKAWIEAINEELEAHHRNST